VAERPELWQIRYQGGGQDRSNTRYTFKEVIALSPQRGIAATKSEAFLPS
jgi:hypothetical protein